MVRLGDRRFLGKMSALDVILGFILASMLARAVNGSSAFFPTLIGGFVLILPRRLLAMLSFHSESFGNLVKGRAEVVVEHGQCVRSALRTHKISEKDLLEEIRLHGQVPSVDEVEVATIERNGKISVLRKLATKTQAPARALAAIATRGFRNARTCPSGDLDWMVSRHRDKPVVGPDHNVFRLRKTNSLPGIRIGSLSSARVPALEFLRNLGDIRCQFEAALVLATQGRPSGSKKFQGQPPSDERQNTKRNVYHDSVR